MLKEKAGEIAGKIWNALNETEGLTAKQIKKATKLVDKDLFLGLGWLLREDKISTQEVEGELFVKLNEESDWNVIKNALIHWICYQRIFFVRSFSYLCPRYTIFALQKL